MIKSMTGYGKSQAVLEKGTLTIEIRTLNGKTADLNLRSCLLPKDKELEVRSRIANSLGRGTIDVFLSWEANAENIDNQINTELVKAYSNQISEITQSVVTQNQSVEAALILSSVLRLPGVVETKKSADFITEDNWAIVSKAIDSCLKQVNEYRELEGQALYKDVTNRVNNILSLYSQVESHESERIDAVKTKILKAADELQVKLNEERFEQEMIFYLEKLDINEEKVRLRQHCKYFFETIDGEAMPGKKLGFIIQEMGREINTTGSKANHAAIQKLVIQMKDELEKVREQSLNIL